MYKNLSKYIERLEREGELVRISAPVSPVLEIAEITDRVSKSQGGGRALLFENVVGSDFPVVTNLFGSERRIAMALGAESLDEISERLDGLLCEAMSPKGSFAEKVRTLPLLAEASKWFPRRVSGRGECQQAVLRGDEARLSLLPILKCWPHDGGRFVTLPLVHTVHPETGATNVGMYRMQIFDDHTTGMHWHVHKTGARHYDAYRHADVARMPVTVCLGGDPAYTYAATAPMPDGMDEYILAGFLRRSPVRLVKCLTNDLWIPSDCDFVIEGYVDTGEPLKVEGPFGDHTGFYSLEDIYPVFHVTAITHRRDAVWPATLVGIPPQEDAWFAAATERIFLPPIRRALQPEVHDLHMPPAGVAHNLAIVSMNVSYAGQPEKVANALWGAGQMMFNKVLIAAPAGFPIRDLTAVSELLRGVDVSRDLVFGHGVLDILDHATATPGIGGKLLIDATRQHGLQTISRPKCQNAANLHRKPTLPSTELTSSPSNTPSDDDCLGFVGKLAFFDARFDPAAKGLTPDELLWLGLANIDPVRDIKVGDGIAVVDCRAKIKDSESDAADCGSSRKFPDRWPNVTVMDKATVRLVDSRWAEYRIGGMPTPGGEANPLPSPSERYRKLLFSDGAEA